MWEKTPLPPAVAGCPPTPARARVQRFPPRVLSSSLLFQSLFPGRVAFPPLRVKVLYYSLMLNYYQLTFIGKDGKVVFRLKAWGKNPRDAVLRLPATIKERVKRLGAKRYRWKRLR